jgi:hypothetical protein
VPKSEPDEHSVPLLPGPFRFFLACFRAEKIKFARFSAFALILSKCISKITMTNSKFMSQSQAPDAPLLILDINAYNLSRIEREIQIFGAICHKWLSLCCLTEVIRLLRHQVLCAKTAFRPIFGILSPGSASSNPVFHLCSAYRPVNGTPVLPNRNLGGTSVEHVTPSPPLL